jgi:hypothetical protein
VEFFAALEFLVVEFVHGVKDVWNEV